MNNILGIITHANALIIKCKKPLPGIYFVIFHVHKVTIAVTTAYIILSLKYPNILNSVK